MVYDFLASTCGREFVSQLPETSYHKPREVQTLNPSYDDPGLMGYAHTVSYG